MENSNRPQTVNPIKKIFRKAWCAVPFLVGVWWVLMCIYAISAVRIIAVLIAGAMLVIDCREFSVLLHNSDKLKGVHWKRTILLVIDVVLCIVFGHMVFSVRSEWLGNFFLLICPPLLFIFNIATYAAEEVGARLFRSLLLTDPLLHYMALYLFYLAAIS